MAIVPKNKGDEDKVAQGIMRLAEEDPTIRFENNAETKEMEMCIRDRYLCGAGSAHVDGRGGKKRDSPCVSLSGNQRGNAPATAGTRCV